MNGFSGRLDYTRTHGVIGTAGGSRRVLCPSHPPSPAVVHRGDDHRGDGRHTWTRWDLNPGLPPCKGGALPLSYGPASLGGVSGACPDVCHHERTAPGGSDASV